MPLEDQGTDYLSWRMNLSPSERAEVDYLIHELKGDMATAYLAVKVMRLEARMASPLKLGVKELATMLGTVGASVMAALGATGKAHLP